MTLPKDKSLLAALSPESKTAPVKKARAVARPTAPSMKHATADAQVVSDKQAPPVKPGKGGARAVANEKRIRASFNLPEAQLLALSELKARCLRFGINAKKGEVLAAGVELLRNLPEASFEACMLPVLRSEQKVKNGKMRTK